MLFLAFRNAKQSKELEKNQKALEKAQITIAKLKEQNDKRDDQIKHLRSQKRQIESQGSVFRTSLENTNVETESTYSNLH